MVREGFGLESLTLLSSEELIARAGESTSWRDLYQLNVDITNHRLPDFNASSILEVNFTELANNGLTNVLVDLDLTIRRAGASIIEQGIADHLQEGRHNGAIESLTIVSDSDSNLENFAAQVGADGLFQPYMAPHGRKATKGSLLFWEDLLKEKNFSATSTVNIGDRYEKDVNLPKRGAGIHSVLVEPLGQDYWFDRIRSWRKDDGRALEFTRHRWCKFLDVLGIEKPEGLQDPFEPVTKDVVISE